MHRIFYVIEHEVTGDDENGLFATGNKEVTMYTLKGEQMLRLASLDLEMTDNSEDAIREYLTDNVEGDATFDLVRL